MNAPTVHNPTNFEPSDYNVLDVYDNKRPEYYGQEVEAFAFEVQQWKDELAAAFGPDWMKKIHHCAHCGNGRVRWITAAHHIPTGEVVVFGTDCTVRLGFDNKWAFRLAQLQSKAEAGHARLKVWTARCAFLEANPEFAAAVEQAKLPAHARNGFVQDVIGKLNHYGSLSPRQVDAVIKSLARDVQFAGQKAVEAVEVKGPAPVGRQTVTGEVLSTKVVEGYYGSQVKMLLKLQNNSRAWMTVPAAVVLEKGDTVTVTATFEVSKDDASFAFGKHPKVAVAA